MSQLGSKVVYIAGSVLDKGAQVYMCKSAFRTAYSQDFALNNSGTF